MWVFGESYFTFLADGRIVLVYFSAGADHLAVIEDGALRDVPLEFTRIVDLTTDGRRALFVGASPTRALRVVALDVDSGAVEQLSAADDELDRRGVRLGRARGRVPDHGRQDRARALLSARITPSTKGPRTSARRSSCASTAARRRT